MENNPNISNIIPFIEKWWDALCSKVEASMSLNKKIYLVAISRKMPRLIDWIENDWIEGLDNTHIEKRKTQIKKIREIGVVSEHAIPLIISDSKSCDDSFNRIEIIVIDDIIITGKSMRDVVADIYDSIGIEPSISAIFISESCKNLNFLHASYINKENSKVVCENDIRNVVAQICSLIKRSSLPMELEFPIFHINATYHDIKTVFLTECEKSEYRCYEIFHNLDDNKSTENLSVILEHELRWTLNHDYAKLRLFKKRTNAVLEVSAPRVINVFESQSASLFKIKDYADVWLPIIEAIKNNHHTASGSGSKTSERIGHREALTLAVWANYLFSLSVGMNTYNSTSLISKIAANPFVEEKDITLLIGKDKAAEIAPLINHIVAQKIVEPQTIERYYDTIMYLVSDKLRERYENKRYQAANNHSSIEESLRFLWESHLNPKTFDLKDEELDMLSEVGETISSIEELFDYSHSNDTKAFVKDINREIDRGVDEGRVSPFYAEIKDSSGELCWRRFYRGGSSSIL